MRIPGRIKDENTGKVQEKKTRDFNENQKTKRCNINAPL